MSLGTDSTAGALFVELGHAENNNTRPDPIFRTTKITGTDLKSDGNEVAIETIEIAHEGITIAN